MPVLVVLDVREMGIVDGEVGLLQEGPLHGLGPAVGLVVTEVGHGGAVGGGELIAEGVQSPYGTAGAAVVAQGLGHKPPVPEPPPLPRLQGLVTDPSHRPRAQQLEGYVEGMAIGGADRPQGLRRPQDADVEPVSLLPEPVRVLQALPMIEVGVAHQHVHVADHREAGPSLHRPAQGGQAASRVQEEEVLPVEYGVAGRVVGDSGAAGE
jgi:hypothetical protein